MTSAASPHRARIRNIRPVMHRRSRPDINDRSRLRPKARLVHYRLVPRQWEGVVLVELAVGDAYGAGFEYADPEFVAAHNTLQGYVQHPAHPGVRPGAYTDDTQMTLAITELLISGEPWTAQRLA